MRKWLQLQLQIFATTIITKQRKPTITTFAAIVATLHTLANNHTTPQARNM